MYQLRFINGTKYCQRYHWWKNWTMLSAVMSHQTVIKTAIHIHVSFHADKESWKKKHNRNKKMVQFVCTHTLKPLTYIEGITLCTDQPLQFELLTCPKFLPDYKRICLQQNKTSVGGMTKIHWNVSLFGPANTNNILCTIDGQQTDWL